MFKHTEIKGDNFVPPNAPSRCTWTPGKPQSDSVHNHRPYPISKPKIYPNILYHIGNTPLVCLNKIGKAEGLECELLVKCEYLNAGGSVKDRIVMRMIEEAERDGRLKPGMTLIEPTSGNTGIGIAMAAAVKGYRSIIVMPDKNSQEKVDTLRAFGSEIVRTPTDAHSDAPESNIGVAVRLNQEIPNSLILNQYRNPANPLTHYDQTAEEILDQCDGKVDMVVAGAGTGGTISGIGRKFKEKRPDCIVVGVDPVGSILAESEQSKEVAKAAFYEVEGIGYDFVPTVLDRSAIDMWVKAEDKESFIMARRLIKEEGILCGGSSGANVAGAIKAAKRLKAGQRCVVILPDTAHNYMTKFLNDDWMAERDYLNVEQEFAEKYWWWELKVNQLQVQVPLTIAPTITVQNAIAIMEKEGYHQLPVIRENGSIAGVVTQGGLISLMRYHKAQPDSTVESVVYKQFKKVHSDMTLGKLSRILDTDHFALLIQEQKQVVAPDQISSKEMVVGIVTRIDLLNFISSREASHENGHTQ